MCEGESERGQEGEKKKNKFRHTVQGEHPTSLMVTEGFKKSLSAVATEQEQNEEKDEANKKEEKQNRTKSGGKDGGEQMRGCFG